MARSPIRHQPLRGGREDPGAPKSRTPRSSAPVPRPATRPRGGGGGKPPKPPRTGRGGCMIWIVLVLGFLVLYLKWKAEHP